MLLAANDQKSVFVDAVDVGDDLLVDGADFGEHFAGGLAEADGVSGGFEDDSDGEDDDDEEADGDHELDEGEGAARAGVG